MGSIAFHLRGALSSITHVMNVGWSSHLDLGDKVTFVSRLPFLSFLQMLTERSDNLLGAKNKGVTWPESISWH